MSMSPCFTVEDIENPACFFLPSILHHSADGWYWKCQLCHTVNGFYPNPFNLSVQAFNGDDPLVSCVRCHAFSRITFPECGIL